MKGLILQSNYIPWKGYFDNINSVDIFIIYDDVQYTKHDWRNRNKIKTIQGLQWLSIPIQSKGCLTKKINEVIVLSNDWRQKHWKCIEYNYHKSPFFNLYAPLFKKLYLENYEVSLSKINYQFICLICELLDIQTKIIFSSDYTLEGDRNQKLIGLCKQLSISEYFTGEKAKNYLNESLFLANDIQVYYVDYSNYPIYSQLYGNFEHHVSILDLLFNEGKNAKKFLKSF